MFFQTAKMRSVEKRVHEVLNKAKAETEPEVDLKGLPLFKLGGVGFFCQRTLHRGGARKRLPIGSNSLDIWKGR
jgi:hypothetical protein